MSKIILIFIIFSTSIFSQSNCNLRINKIGNIPIVKSKDLKCIAKESKNKNTIFYSFGIWCSPCKLHLKNAIKLKKKYDINLVILLVEKEKDSIISKTINYLKNIDSKINIAVIDDSYGKRRSKKYRKFLKDITPKKFENLDGMSKYIVLNKKGQVIMVTTWKDNRKYDWKDDSNMIKEKIIPLIEGKK
ncbi:hypothetical protein [Polaribacter sp.]|uniref:hypothetical protein n=1 Tax=Polaribacter sp. TaxID=1920175 RepID=UPI003F6A39D5